MDNPTGIIQSFVDDVAGSRAIVAIDVQAACPRCAAGKGCGAGILSGTRGVRRVEATVPADLELSTGDEVELSLAPNNLLHATLLVYGLPMLGAILGAGIAYLLRLTDAAAAIAAIAGIIAGIFWSRRRLEHSACLSDFVPNIHRRLRPANAGR